MRVSSLDFRKPSEWGIVVVIDGERLSAPGRSFALPTGDARIVVRLLQGWVIPDVKRVHRRVREPFARGPGWFGYSSAPGPPVLVTLPGGDEPPIDADELSPFRHRIGIPVTSCDCGSGTGCAALRVMVSRESSQIVWTTDDGRQFRFLDRDYQAGMRRLLRILGERPRLLDRGRNTQHETD